jgi:hypothetical protein
MVHTGMMLSHPGTPVIDRRLMTDDCHLTLRNFSQADRLAPVKTPEEPGKRAPGAMKYAGLGVQLAVSLLVFVWVGQWADRKLGTGGVLTVVAAFLGFGGTMYWLIRSLNRKDGPGE